MNRRCLPRPRRLLLLFALFPLLPGCLASQNPSYFPHMGNAGWLKRTHAKPGGSAYYSNFDPHAVRLEVRPIDTTVPVRTHKVFLATVYDEKGNPRRDRRIEWMLEGVGNIIEVDESGMLPGRGYKVDNKYAVSYTNYLNHLMTRGNINPNDDFQLRPGQSWLVVSSAVEGDTQLTVYAPEIHDWDKNKVVVTTHWVDAEWSLPPPASARTGQEVPLTTTVFRHTDHQPLTSYRVRYRILDGPPAVLLPSRSQEAVEITDLRGHGPVSIAQVSPQPGVNRVGVEIIRPPDPTAPSGVGIVIGHGETTVTWLAPQVSLSVSSPPTVSVGQEYATNIQVANSGQIPIQALTVNCPIPQGVQFIRSTPPAVMDGGQLVWTLGNLQAGQSLPLQAVFKTSIVGSLTTCARVTTVEGLRDEKCSAIQVTTPQLNVTLSGPQTGIVDTAFAMNIVVSNPGSSAANNVMLVATFDQALEHSSRANPLELPIGTLGPGESKTTILNLTPRQVGRFATTVTGTADGNLRMAAESQINVQKPQLSVTQSGPPVRYVDQTATWDIRVANLGDLPLSNVVVRDQLPPEVLLLNASEGGQVGANQLITWNVGPLNKGDQKVLQVVAKCAKIAPKSLNVVSASADPGLTIQAPESSLEIRGLPAFELTLMDVGDPAEVGGRVTYKIGVTNTGSLPANGVEIAAVIPPQMRLINALGPTTPRFEGQRVVFPPPNQGLPPAQQLAYSVDVQAVQVADVRFQVELRSDTLKDPVLKEESTTIYAPTQAGAAPPLAATPPPPTFQAPSPGSSVPGPPQPAAAPFAVPPNTPEPPAAQSPAPQAKPPLPPF